MSTMYDVAREAGVSQTTVSFVLNNDKRCEKITAETREKVLFAAQKLDYRFNMTARSLSTGKSNRVSLAVGRPNEVGFAMAVAFEEYCRQHGYTVNLVFARHQADETFNESWDAIFETIVQSDPAGVAFFFCMPNFVVPMVERFDKLSKPHVALEIDQPGVDALIIDRTVGFYQATKHLIDIGRQRIAYVGRPGYKRSKDGYHQALAESNMKPMEILAEADLPEPGMFHFAQTAAERFLAQDDRPDGAICHNDETALGLLYGFHRLGVRVPDDVAVVGFDNIKAASLSYPALTTIGQPQEEAGRVAAEILLKKINGESPPSGGWGRALPVNLIFRETA